MSQPTEYENVSYNAPDGAQFGRATTEKIAFYGSTPIVQPTVSSAISTTASISTAGLYGFATSTEALQVVNAVSTMAFALKQLGLVV